MGAENILGETGNQVLGERQETSNQVLGGSGEKQEIRCWRGDRNQVLGAYGDPEISSGRAGAGGKTPASLTTVTAKRVSSPAPCVVS